MKPQHAFFCVLSFLSASVHAQNPGGVTGSTLWLRADQGNTSTTTDGNNVWYWVDLSGTGTLAYNLGATEPTYWDDATNDVNFNPVLDFSGGNLMTLLSTAGLPGAKTARTVLAVGVPYSATGTQYMVSWGTGTGSEGYSLGAFNTEGILSGVSASLTTPAGFWTANQSGLFTGTWAGGNNGAMNLYGAGALLTGPTNESFNTILGKGVIGEAAWGGSGWNGSIAEIIVYPSVLSGANLEKVGTYLALKYGFTLGGAAPQNYLSSTSSTIWNATSMGTWSNHIAGVGRDDNDGLYQLQSRNTDPGFQVTIGVGGISTTNARNNTNINPDRSFMIWGDDNKATTYTRTIVAGGTTYYAMARTWAVTKTNWTDQNIVINQDSGARSVEMLVATDAGFTNVTQRIALTGGAVTVNSSKIPSGSFVTFAEIIPLPVNLISFTGQATKTGNELSWRTAGETDNAYFSIERSTDARNYIAVGRVEGHGTTVAPEQYTFEDADPVPGTLNYYRLRQVDVDGWSSYSSVVSLRNDGGPLAYKAYPNPAQSTLHLDVPIAQARLGIFFYTIGGKLVQSETVTQPGEGIDLDVSRLRTGLYYLLLVQADGERRTLSFIKQ